MMKKDMDNNKQRQEIYEKADINEKLIKNLRNISHTMHFLYEGRGSQSRILIILLENETITQQELTEKLGIKPGSASEVILKLEKNGLIERTKSMLDRRTANIKLTEKGKILAQEAGAQRELRHKEMFSSLSEEEKNSLLSLLEKINSDWKSNYSDKGGHHHRHKKHHHGHHGDGDRKRDCDGNCRECKHPCH